MEAPALVPAFALPAMDGAFVEPEGRDDGPRRATVCQQGYDVTSNSYGLCAR